MKKEKTDYTQMPVLELKSLVNSKKEQLFKLRIANASAPLKNTQQIWQLRRDIARVLTHLRQKENNQEKGQGTNG